MSIESSNSLSDNVVSLTKVELSFDSGFNEKDIKTNLSPHTVFSSNSTTCNYI